MRLIRNGFLLLVVIGFAVAPMAELSAASLGAPRVSAPRSGASPLVQFALTVAAAGAIGGVIRIKDTASIAKKFVSRAGVAGADYTDGVRSAGADWETNAKNSEDNYKASVTQAANEGRFGRGIAAAGAAKYVDKASTLGAQRYPTGVAASEGAYARGVQPHLDMMKSLDLPPRRPKGQNAQRAQIVADANRKLKVGK
jgi:hypothetical protein